MTTVTATAPPTAATRLTSPAPAIAGLSRQEMYNAVSRRDETYIGAFFVGVTTTGIFCRPGCPAKAPHMENCEFFPRAQDAMLAGYRACKRCKPLTAPAQAPLWAEHLTQLMQDHPERQ